MEWWCEADEHVWTRKRWTACQRVVLLSLISSDEFSVTKQETISNDHTEDAITDMSLFTCVRVCGSLCGSPTSRARRIATALQQPASPSQPVFSSPSSSRLQSHNTTVISDSRRHIGEEAHDNNNSYHAIGSMHRPTSRELVTQKTRQVVLCLSRCLCVQVCERS